MNVRGRSSAEARISFSTEPVLLVSQSTYEISGVVERLARFAQIIAESTERTHRLDGQVLAPSGSEPQGLVTSELPTLIATERQPTELDHRRALAIGASGLIHSAMTTGQLKSVWLAAAAGCYRLPIEIGHLLAQRLDTPSPTLELGEREQTILTGLQQGDSVATIGRRVGCSERHTRRLICSIWATLGVQNRSQGLVVAARQGLIGS